MSRFVGISYIIVLSFWSNICFCDETNKEHQVKGNKRAGGRVLSSFGPVDNGDYNKQIQTNSQDGNDFESNGLWDVLGEQNFGGHARNLAKLLKDSEDNIVNNEEEKRAGGRNSGGRAGYFDKMWKRGGGRFFADYLMKRGGGRFSGFSEKDLEKKLGGRYMGYGGYGYDKRAGGRYSGFNPLAYSYHGRYAGAKRGLHPLRYYSRFMVRPGSNAKAKKAYQFYSMYPASIRQAKQREWVE